MCIPMEHSSKFLIVGNVLQTVIPELHKQVQIVGPDLYRHASVMSGFLMQSVAIMVCPIAYAIQFVSSANTMYNLERHSWTQYVAGVMRVQMIPTL